MVSPQGIDAAEHPSTAHFPANTDSPSIDETVGEVLRQQAAATPDRPAIIEWIGSSSQLASTSYAALLDAATVAR